MNNMTATEIIPKNDMFWSGVFYSQTLWKKITLK